MKSRIYSPDLLYEDFYYYVEKDAAMSLRKFIEKNITSEGDPFDDDDDDDHLDELPFDELPF